MDLTQRTAALRLADELQRFDGPERESLRDEAAALLRELAADPVVNQSLTTEPQGEPVARPPTPPGWSDTDWLRHLESCLPIGYAVRDTLYGTSKAGVLRLCSSTEAGAFALYAAPQPQATEPSQDTPPQGEPVQKPVAWWCKHPHGGGFMTCDELAAQHYMHKFRRAGENGPTLVPLYAAPQQRNPLTDEQIDAVTREQWSPLTPMYAAHRAFARAIERMHGIKETP